MADIKIHHLRLQMDNRLILDIVDQTIPCHSITGIIGPNGAGKTSLLQSIVGIIPEAKADLSIVDGPPVMVLHHTPFIRMSVIDNLRLLKNTYPGVTESRIAKVIQDFDLSVLANQAATKLSAGEKQRVSLARAYLTDAKLLFLDEPTSSLDPNVTLMIESKIKELNQFGIRFVIISHDFAQIKRICKDVVFVQDGKILETGSTMEFFRSPKTTQAKSFLDFYQTILN
jgi:tungstate transport system ATP-binding protein